LNHVKSVSPQNPNPIGSWTNSLGDSVPCRWNEVYTEATDYSVLIAVRKWIESGDLAQREISDEEAELWEWADKEDVGRLKREMEQKEGLSPSGYDLGHTRVPNDFHS
jgi:hypothetical protein